MSSNRTARSNSSEAYRLFCSQVYDMVRSIPPGKVMTYGGIASLIPKPREMDPLAFRQIRARWVGYALKSCPENVPWWRVVNAQGQVSIRMGHGPYVQPLMLEEEGIPLESGQIPDLNMYLWSPKEK